MPIRRPLATVPMAALLIAACGGASMPRIADPLPVQQFQDVGAMADASRGFPVAFYANPGDQPDVIELPAGGCIHGSQWMVELARTMNVALAKATLFDERFKPLAQQVFNYEVDNGDVSYAWREPASGPDFGGARVVTLKLNNFKTFSSLGEGITGQATVEVNIRGGGFTKYYACEKTGARWDRDTFTCVGERILGDPGFWKGVASAP
ncbi:MAG: hypothetical protein EXR79_15235 [Myxococcales bacterium]|nr:hypothetical protein [Myxococcales bacterium]